MDSLLQQKRRNKDEEKQQQTETTQPGSPPSPTTSSPSHEFSFTISLHQPPAATSCCAQSAAAAAATAADKTKTPASSIALDLSPADDIFFHGHLLPLHLLSHLPVSPRSSTNSMDSFTLPIKDLLAADHHHDDQTTTTTTDTISYDNTGGDNYNYSHHSCYPNNEEKESESGSGGRPKSKSFSWLSSKWRKEMSNNNDRSRSEIKEKLEDKERQQQQRKRKLKLDMSELLKRYMRMVRPLLSFRNSRRPERPQSYSFSGNLSLRRKQEDYYYNGRKRGGEFSAPASMRTSPTNSGLLVATTPSLSSSSTSTSHDSTMEELQAAIQAAIAHCKNSIAVEDKIKCHHD